MKTVLLIASFMILTGATMLAGQVRLSGFDIREEGRDFVITWQSELEEDVRQFEIQRKTPFSNDQFV